MGCVSSRFEEEEVVSICRERKHQLKLAVERRYALADAHYRYCQSLFGVSAALSLFVARHSSPPTPFYITFPPRSPSSPHKENNSVVSNPLFLQQTPSKPTNETIPCISSATSIVSSAEDSDERIEPEEERECGYFYRDMPYAAPVSPQRNFGWDFFNPFDNAARLESLSAFNRISEEDLRAVREQEGIPELEDELGECVEQNIETVVEQESLKTEKLKEHGSEAGNAVDVSKMNQGEILPKGLAVIDTPVKGRELLEALKDIEDHFVRAYDSGKEVSRMLECNRFHLMSNLDEIKETSTKLMQTIAWRTPSSRSSSSKSLIASGSRRSSTWTEFSNDLFDDWGGMNSGSLSSTLGRLYAWEKKLLEEVREGDCIRRIYEKKCNQLRNQVVKGDEGLSVDKTRASVKDLYSRILVAIRSAETISSRIEKLIDEELEPQIRELLQGMMKTWKIMLESHEIQNKIIFEVMTFACPSYGKFCNESHRLATLQLETELLNWRSCFMEYVSAEREYAASLYAWLSKFVAPEVEIQPRGRTVKQAIGPRLLELCHDWIDLINNLPTISASSSIKSCAKDVRALWFQQGVEQQQKRRVDSLSKELQRKMLTFQKSTSKDVQFLLTDGSGATEQPEMASEPLREDMVQKMRTRLDLEKDKHLKCMRETERITLNGLQTGFSRVFEAMLEFSKSSLKMYEGLCSSTQGGDGSKQQRCTESKHDDQNARESSK